MSNRCAAPLFVREIVGAVLASVLLLGASVHAAPSETVLHNFGKQPDGRYPTAGLLLDAKTGSLFGTTGWGGTGNCPLRQPSLASYDPVGCGTIFELTPPAAGKTTWTERVLYNFTALGIVNENDADPSGVIMDSSGVLYGTAMYGGTTGSGTVFALTPPKPGTARWVESTLLNFKTVTGINPSAELIMDNSGALYGTTFADGTAGPYKSAGTVFELTRPTSGTANWTMALLFGFTGKNGNAPAATLLRDAGGNLYGTTFGGGAQNLGTVFELVPPSSGQTAWQETVIFSFTQKTGNTPQAGLVMDSNGVLYGTTTYGGSNDLGTIFQLSPTKSGGWKQTIILNCNTRLGASPVAALIIDKSGALYGTTSAGGAYGKGTVFKLVPPKAGKSAWTDTILHSFKGAPYDGATPGGPLIMDKAGALYGTTVGGGSYGNGMVFKITP